MGQISFPQLVEMFLRNIWGPHFLQLIWHLLEYSLLGETWREVQLALVWLHLCILSYKVPQPHHGILCAYWCMSRFISLWRNISFTICRIQNKNLWTTRDHEKILTLTMIWFRIDFYIFCSFFSSLTTNGFIYHYKDSLFLFFSICNFIKFYNQSLKIQNGYHVFIYEFIWKCNYIMWVESDEEQSCEKQNLNINLYYWGK